MKTQRLTVAIIATTTTGLFGLSACSGSDTGTAKTAPTTAAAIESTTSAADPSTSAVPETTTPETTPETAPISDIQTGVDLFTTALTDLRIEYTEPVRTEVQMSGAKASFDITVNGYDAGILIFPAIESRERWQEVSDTFGGVHVASGIAVLTPNSKDGIANSAEIAPKIAAAIGGEARGV